MNPDLKAAMENVLPDHVNKRRRKTLSKYTFLALIVYFIPIISSYIAKYIGVANIRYIEATYLLVSVLSFYAVFFTIIWLKKQVTVRFIYTMLHVQIFVAYCHISAYFYVMQDLRILTLFASMLSLIFVFIQSSLLISYIVVAFIAIDYLFVAYIGIVKMGQPGNILREMLIIMLFLPVSYFLGYMCNIVQKQHKELKTSRDELKKTYSELETTHATLESYNERMLESIHYAEMIQRSLLPGLDRMKTQNPDSLVIWMPKDIVGGDIFYTYTVSGKTIVALMDCTGHGVPGAFLTMIAYTEIRKIILDHDCHDPAEILRRMNVAMKNVLHKNSDKQMVNDGLDAAVVNIDHKKKTLVFAGARVPMFYVENKTVTQIKGEKASIGYRDSDINHTFINQTITFSADTWVYLKTDGLTDQLGGPERLRFGTRKLENLILNVHESPFHVQRKEILNVLFEHQGNNEQMDDITVIGFKI